MAEAIAELTQAAVVAVRINPQAVRGWYMVARLSRAQAGGRGAMGASRSEAGKQGYAL